MFVLKGTKQPPPAVLIHLCWSISSVDESLLFLNPEPLSPPFPVTVLLLTPESSLQSYLFLRIWPKDNVSTEIRERIGSNNTHHFTIHKYNLYMYV